MRNLQHFYLPAISTCYKQRSPGSTPGLLRLGQEIDDDRGCLEAGGHIYLDPAPDDEMLAHLVVLRVAARRIPKRVYGVAPVERISRRSQVHRPSIGWLAQPLEALCRVPGSPLPARLRRQWRRPGHRLRLRPASCVRIAIAG